MPPSDRNKDSACCPTCAIGPFTRNNYFTGKLLVERDFKDETRFHMEKMRHHNQQLHGTGVVCGLKVTQHENKECRDRFIYIEPGTAIDCCGHEIVVRQRETVEIASLEPIRALMDQHDAEPHRLQICLRFKQCPTEDIPVLYDECGCDDTRCAPNRILESYSVSANIVPIRTFETPVVVRPPNVHAEVAEPGSAHTSGGEAARVAEENPCRKIFSRHLKGCPECNAPDWVVLATIDNYHVGDSIEEQTDPPATAEDDIAAHIARIDNSGRRLLPSTQTLTEVIECILEHGGSSTGPQGPPGENGKDGTNGIGLNPKLPKIIDIEWEHNSTEYTWQDFNRFQGIPNHEELLKLCNELNRLPLLTVYFSNTMTNIDRQTFRVRLEYPRFLDVQNLNTKKLGSRFTGTFQTLDLYGEVIPWRTPLTTPHTAEQSPYAVSFIPYAEFFDFISTNLNDLWMGQRYSPTLDLPKIGVLLKGDFIWEGKNDEFKEDSMLDADNIGGRVGFGKRYSGDMVQGGNFESWFFLNKPKTPPEG